MRCYRSRPFGVGVGVHTSSSALQAEEDRRSSNSVLHRRLFWACGCVLALLFAASIRLAADREDAQAPARPATVQRAEPAAPVAQATAVPDQALVQKYCSTCHNDRAKTGGI